MSCQQIAIREARREDAPVLAQLYVEAFGAKMRWAFGKYESVMPAVVQELLEADQMRLGETLVAEVDGQVAGMAVLRRDHTYRHSLRAVWRLVRRHVHGWNAFTTSFLLSGLCNNLSTPRSAYLEALAVNARYRGQGIGTLLLERCFEEARRAGKQEVSLHVVDTNPRAKQLYVRMGFRSVRVERYGWFVSRWMGFSAQEFMVHPL